MKLERNEEDLEAQPKTKRAKLDVRHEIVEIEDEILTSGPENMTIKTRKSKRLISKNNIKTKPNTLVKFQEIDNIVQNIEQISPESFKTEQNTSESTIIIDTKDESGPEINDKLKNDIAFEIIKIKPPKIPKKELKISPKPEKPAKNSKKEDPDTDDRPFGMLPLRDINELFGDIPHGVIDQFNAELDFQPTIVIIDDVNDHQPTINIDNEVSDDDDCLVVTFKCEKCPKSFDSEKLLSNHLKIHELKYCCNICNKKYGRERQLKRHKLYDHDYKGRFSCATCGKKFNRQLGLEFHRKKVHEVNQPIPKKCPFCGFECVSEKRFKKHQNTHKDGDKKIKIEKKPKIEVKDEKKVFKFKAVKTK